VRSRHTSILEAVDDDANKMLSDVWILVANDQAVAGKVAEFDIAIITPSSRNSSMPRSCRRSSWTKRPDVEKRKSVEVQRGTTIGL
jgi:hypothetical protein